MSRGRPPIPLEKDKVYQAIYKRLEDRPMTLAELYHSFNNEGIQGVSRNTIEQKLKNGKSAAHRQLNSVIIYGVEVWAIIGNLGRRVEAQQPFTDWKDANAYAMFAVGTATTWRKAQENLSMIRDLLPPSDNPELENWRR